MWFVAKCRRWVWSVWLAVGWLAQVHALAAQELPRVSTTRMLLVAGVGVDQKNADLLGLSRIKFQGLIASELASVGYRIASADDAAVRHGESAPLTLTGSVREEICDDIAPSQCRIAILWDLQDHRGATVYRALTRAVEQRATLEELRRALITQSLHSLLKRRRFALQLTDVESGSAARDPEPLGFKQCRRSALELPHAARSAAASLVLVESGSNLARGAIISGDGLILTSAKAILPGAPLRVRFSAQQTLPGDVVAIDRAADVALVHVAVNTDKTCLPLGEGSLPSGTTVFGVSSELAEDAAVSLGAGPVLKSLEVDGKRWVQIDSRVARADGGPVLDAEARLFAVASGQAPKDLEAAVQAIEVGSALQALNIKPAAISDPRLVGAQKVEPAVSYVRDRDDPPFVLTKRYTYGTSPTARRLRTASLVVTGAAAFGVAATWVTFRHSPDMSPAAHQRTVVLNDLSWVLLGLGAVGIGASFAWPEGHEVVEGHGSARRELFIGVASGGLSLTGSI
jgi:S1-C subfamily serine protease